MNAISTPSRRSALMVAIDSNVSNDFFKMLLSYNPLLDLKDTEGQTALHHAAKKSNRTQFHLLIVAGADPRIKDNKGKTVDEHLH